MKNPNKDEMHERFLRLRKQVENPPEPPEEEDLRRAKEIRRIVRLPGDLSFDEAVQEKVSEELERHQQLSDETAIAEADSILKRLEESPELRKAVLPRLFRDSDTAVGEWHWAWHELERELREIEERQCQREAQGQDSDAESNKAGQPSGATPPEVSR